MPGSVDHHPRHAHPRGPWPERPSDPGNDDVALQAIQIRSQHVSPFFHSSNQTKAHYDCRLDLFCEKVSNRALSAIVQAESLKYKLRSGLAVRRACYGVLRFIMEGGAKGCEVVVSGKLRAARAKSMKVPFLSSIFFVFLLMDLVH